MSKGRLSKEEKKFRKQLRKTGIQLTKKATPIFWPMMILAAGALVIKQVKIIQKKLAMLRIAEGWKKQ